MRRQLKFNGPLIGLLHWVLPMLCFLAAISTANYGRWDLRADKVDAALSRATEAPSDIARATALTEARELLVDRRETGRLHHQAARLALTERPLDFDRIRTESYAGLARNPAQGDAWARLAYVNTIQAGRLGSMGQDALRHSFDTIPYGNLSFQQWRIEFTLSLWQDLDDNLQLAARRSLRNFGTTAWGRNWLTELLARLENRRAEDGAIEAIEQVLGTNFVPRR